MFCVVEHPRLARSMTLYTGDAALADEIAQEALVRVIRRWDRVRDMASPGAYAQRIALNLARSSFRRRQAAHRARRRLAAGAPSVHTDADAGDAVAVQRALAALPHDQRAAVVLRHVLELSVAEAAAALGCPENTVKTRCRRGLASLRRLLEEPAEVATP